MTLFQRTVSGIVWFFSGQIARMVLQLIVLMVLARLIEVKVLGAIFIAVVVVNYSLMFSLWYLNLPYKDNQTLRI